MAPLPCLVPSGESITFELTVVGRTADGSTNRETRPIEIPTWSVGSTKLDPYLGEFTQLSMDKVRGPGGCKLSVTGRLVGPYGETRSTYDGITYILNIEGSLPDAT